MRVLLSESEIRQGVTRLAQQIHQDYQSQPLTILGVLTGSLVLLADLIRQIDLPLRVGVLQASSYRGEAQSPGELVLNADFLPSLADQHVLLIDDIFDTGKTLQAVKTRLHPLGPLSVRTAVLLWKTARRQVDLTPDYHCFQIPDEFVVGYGLDFDNQYRQLPYIACIESSANSGPS